MILYLALYRSLYLHLLPQKVWDELNNKTASVVKEYISLLIKEFSVGVTLIKDYKHLWSLFLPVTLMFCNHSNPVLFAVNKNGTAFSTGVTEVFIFQLSKGKFG